MSVESSNPDKLFSASATTEALMPLLRLALLGDLAAGLLHQINNPVTAILSYARLLQFRNTQPEDVADFAKSIEFEGERIAELTHQISQLVRSKQFDNRGANLKEALSLALQFYDTRFRNDGIVVQCDLAKSLPETSLVLEALQQILLLFLEQVRLAVNSTDLSQETGKILRFHGNEVHCHDKNWLRLSAVHHGLPRMSNEPLNLFSHLLPSPPQKEHTSLSVAITQALLSKFDCKIETEPRVGEGALHLYLPVKENQT